MLYLSNQSSEEKFSLFGVLEPEHDFIQGIWTHFIKFMTWPRLITSPLRQINSALIKTTARVFSWSWLFFSIAQDRALHSPGNCLFLESWQVCWIMRLLLKKVDDTCWKSAGKMTKNKKQMPTQLENTWGMTNLCFFGNMDEKWGLCIKFPPSKPFTSSPLTPAALGAQLPSRSQCASNHSQTPLSHRRRWETEGASSTSLRRAILVWRWNEPPRLLQWRRRLIYWWKQHRLHEVYMFDPWKQSRVQSVYRL